MRTRWRSFNALVYAGCLSSFVWSHDPLLAQSLPPECSTTGIAGVLRVSSVNPRYFTNDCGKAIYMTGSHTWNNFPDMDDTHPPENQPFDYAQYLNFLDQYNHNFIRLWAWEGPFPDNADYYPRRIWAGPQPWLRTGPGNDITGHLKFDLTQWNQAYFDRLRQRVSQAQARGKFVSIMLFEGWALRYAPGKYSHPFNSANNINGISFGSAITNIHALNVLAITAIQEEYIRRVVDSVNDLDNVLYEIINEPSVTYATPWQAHMIQFVKQYEATKPKQHPVGMTWQSGDDDNSILFSSAAEWISPGFGGYDSEPPASNGSKVIFNDTDHLGGSSFGDRTWVWKSFMRGLNTLFMDRYDLPHSITNGPIANAIEMRTAMGNTLTFSRRMDFLHTIPNGSISSTGYALTNSSECLVYTPSSSSFTVNLQNYAGSLQVEWFSPATQQTTLSGAVAGGATRTFQAPSGSDAVLYLRSGATGVQTEESPLASRPSLRASPNPSSGAVKFVGHSGSATGSHGILRVFDVAGRLVFENGVTVFGNRFEQSWGGLTASGARLSSGIYVAKVTIGTEDLTARFVLAK